jgi:hypothetical protein
VKDSCVVCWQFVHQRIHPNVSAKLDTPEILFVDAKMWMNVQKIHVEQEQDVLTKPEDTNVNARKEQGETLTFRVAVELLQNLNVRRMPIAPDNCPAKPQFVSILAPPSHVEPTPSVFPKTMQLGAGVKLVSQRMMMENVFLCVIPWFVEPTPNVYPHQKDLPVLAQREQVEILSQEEIAYPKHALLPILAQLQCLAYLENVERDVMVFLVELELFVTPTHSDVFAKMASSEMVTFYVCHQSFPQFANLVVEEAVIANMEHQINATVTAEPRETPIKDAQVKLINVPSVETMQSVSRKEAKTLVNAKKDLKAVHL